MSRGSRGRETPPDRDKLIALAPRRTPGPTAQRSDDELVLLARGGYRRAFDALARRYQSASLRIAAKLLGDATLAKDAVQNTFLRLHAALDRYRARDQFSAFFRRILLDECRMILRSHGRHARRVERATRMDPTESGRDAEDVILARERRLEVERALGRLSWHKREILALRYSGELSYREIAELLDIPVGTAKSRVFAALADLRTAFEGNRS